MTARLPSNSAITTITIDAYNPTGTPTRYVITKTSDLELPKALYDKIEHEMSAIPAMYGQLTVKR